MRPLVEDALTLRTCLASHSEESSKVVSELARAFMRKLATFSKPNAFATPAERDVATLLQRGLFDDLNVDLS